MIFLKLCTDVGSALRDIYSLIFHKKNIKWFKRNLAHNLKEDIINILKWAILKYFFETLDI